MMTIWKYPLVPFDVTALEMPEAAKVLSVQVQREQVNLWALGESSAPRKLRLFKIVGTGHNARGIEPENYIGTFQLEGGTLVFHVFEVTERGKSRC